MRSPETPDKYDEMKTLFSSSIDKIELGHFDPRMKDFYKKIKEKYTPEVYGRCLLWHLIIGGTPDETDVNFDLPEGEIESFIRNQLPKIAIKE